MKRFLVFDLDSYCIQGGFKDLSYESDILKEAIWYANTCRCNYSQVVDSERNDIFDITCSDTITFISDSLMYEEYIKEIIYKENGEYELIFV